MRRFITIAEAVYHGSQEDNPNFVMGHTGQNSTTFGPYESKRWGIFFTNNPEFAKIYGKVGEYELDIDNPLDLTERAIFSHYVNAFVESFDPFGPDRDFWMDAKNVLHGTWPIWHLFENKLGERFAAFVQSEGFDSVIFEEDNQNNDDGEWHESVTTVVFNPALVKKIINEKAIGHRAPLYHFTRTEEAFYILQKGFIYASLFGSGKVSATRDPNLNHRNASVRFEISNRIYERFRVEPIDFWKAGRTVGGEGKGRSESEERICGDVPLSYITKITLLVPEMIPDRFWKESDRVKAMAEERGIPIEDCRGSRTTDERKYIEIVESIVLDLVPVPGKPDFFFNPLPNDVDAWTALHVPPGSNQRQLEAVTQRVNLAHRNARETILPIADLIGIEVHVGKRALENPSNDLPFVEHIGGKFYLIDGNHRVVAAYLRGETTVRVMLADIDGDL